MTNKTRCPRCNYEWSTRSEKIYVTCPSCMRKFENKPMIKKETITKEVEQDNGTGQPNNGVLRAPGRSERIDREPNAERTRLNSIRNRIRRDAL